MEHPNESHSKDLPKLQLENGLQNEVDLTHEENHVMSETGNTFPRFELWLGLVHNNLCIWL